MTDTTVWLYGSVARGDDTPKSDLDILVVDDSVPFRIFEHKILQALPHFENLSARQYSWQEIIAMASYGSLFLLHIKLEGRPVVDGLGASRLKGILDELPSYSGRTRDLKGFRIALQDSRTSLADGGDPTFELSVIATVIRHASILACYFIGQPAFDRETSIPRALNSVNLNAAAPGALELYDFRLAQARDIPTKIVPSHELAQTWLNVAFDFITRLELAA